MYHTLLLYFAKFKKWGGWGESNPRMSEPQSDALTTSPAAKILTLNKKKCLETESNCRHMELQSIALPTEPSRQNGGSRRESNPRSPAWQAGVITATPRDLTLILNVFNSNGDPYGIRTRVTAVKGRCLNHLTNGPIKTEQEGFEPSRRFPDHTLSRGALFSLLSTTPTPQAGLEPATPDSTVRCYYQLSYCG